LEIKSLGKSTAAIPAEVEGKEWGRLGRLGQLNKGKIKKGTRNSTPWKEVDTDRVNKRATTQTRDRRAKSDGGKDVRKQKKKTLLSASSGGGQVLQKIFTLEKEYLPN